MAPLHFLVPGALAQRTGGYGYARRIVAGLRAGGRPVVVHELAGRFPDADAAAVASLEAALAASAEGALAVVDGLALAALAAGAGTRARLVALVHHPLGDETDLDAGARARLAAAERAALGRCAGVVTTSAFTAGRVAALGVAPGRIAVVEPGTDPAPRARGGGPVPELLCVASVTPRKGHDVLIDALAAIADRDWHCTCVGSLARAPAWAARVRERARAAGLGARVDWRGELDEAGLAAAWDAADLFVLASRYEGYGMVVTEAIAHGLPVVAAAGGAVADTLPRAAGRLVPPGDAAALATALAALLDDARARARLAAAARRARADLGDWQRASGAFAAALGRLGRA